MSKRLVGSEPPEAQEFGRKLTELAVLEAELAQRELDLATLRGSLSAFQARYLHMVGVRFAELDEARAQIAQARARSSRGDQGAQQEASRTRAQAADSANEARTAGEKEPRKKFQPSESLKRLFREVAKKLHPDLANDEPDRIRRTHLMAEANRAYESGDEAKLQSILADWQSSPEAVRGEGVGIELVRVVRKIAQAERRLQDIEVEREELERADMYRLMLKADEAEADDRDLLTEMAAELDQQISDAKSEQAAVAERS